MRHPLAIAIRSGLHKAIRLVLLVIFCPIILIFLCIAWWESDYSLKEIMQEMMRDLR